MTWRGYLASSAILGVVLGALFADSPLTTTIPMFCLILAVLWMMAASIGGRAR